MGSKNHNQRVAELDVLVDELITAVLENGQSYVINNDEQFGRIKIREEEYCHNCDACFNLMFNIPLLCDLATEKLTPAQVRQRRQTWQYAKLDDQARNGLGDLSRLEFRRTTATNTTKLCYLDQNIFSKFTNDPDVRQALLEIKSRKLLQFVYSPSHLEEVNKIEKISDQQQFLDAISELTENTNLQPQSNDRFGLFIEDPKYPLARVAASPAASIAIESMKVLTNGDRGLYFEEHNAELHRIKIGQQMDIFNAMPNDKFMRVMSQSGTHRYTKEMFKDLTFRRDIINAIYALHNALDLMGYKLEEKERTQRSSVHDIEHLIHATQCQIFVTKDKKLIARASQIYSFMGCQTTVQNLDEFLAAQIVT